MAVSGTKSVSLRGAEAQPQLQSTAEDEDVSTLDKPAKRKTTTSQMTSPERTHKDKRLAVIGQQVIDYGEDRVIDPLGGQAHVQLKVKDAAVSDWLHEQSSKRRLMYWILFDITSVLLVNENQKLLTHRESCFGGAYSCKGA